MEYIKKPFGEAALYTCGEAFSRGQGWVEGALQSAEKLLTEEFHLKPL